MTTATDSRREQTIRELKAHRDAVAAELIAAPAAKEHTLWYNDRLNDYTLTVKRLVSLGVIDEGM
jgi:hypothetical protein